ncbi:hypothetical protein GALMADRAFT_1036264 [Galerina marginata CBS 339.88]|uniref:CDP-diacylglycerol--glycerol-3-phosphate 3-phosphatidyltransferase n=1 Tax=Galerina marginata (strain CBS 339.88) TaxID=685588 RepID=A0A067SP89_GALM3|nr:hypothetical protein GALMADRAFT_1036264 [Galerina marginata CBS 339.88]
MWPRFLWYRTVPRIPYCSSFGRRCITTTSLDPSIRGFTAELVKTQPVFQAPTSAIRILVGPSQFYATLLDIILKAERRIFISSLYIGSEEEELISALAGRLRVKPDLKLDLLLDLNRSTRPGRDSTAKILLPLLNEFPSRINVLMFRSPSLRGILAKVVPPRFNEGWGTWHAKIYGADDNVMISGANLNNSYFTNRQDRYLCFTGQRNIAQYCFDFIQIAKKFSYKLLPTALGSDCPIPAPNVHSYSHEDYTLHWPNPNIHPHHFNSIAETALSQFQEFYHNKSTETLSKSSSTRANHALLIPIIQAGQFNIREEESMFRLLFRSLSQNSGQPLLDLTSGYFSLYPPYQEFILSALNVNTRIVASSPKANGFYGSKGISGRIPEGYTLYEQRFMKAASKARRLWQGPSPNDGQGVLLSEWEKPGWTYHAKGIWLSPSSSTLPVLTLFGSTNLNSRSAHIDTELSFLMILPSEPQADSAAEFSTTASSESSDSERLSLRQGLAREIEGIRSNAVEWKGGDRKVRWTTRFIVWLVKGML